jgi:hypothetical protein
MRLCALILLVPAGLAHAQEPAPPTTQAAAPAAAELTVDKTASPELVGDLVKEVGITPGQAQGAAATLFGVAKGKLTPADFAKVAAAVPNMDGLLKAAPAAAAKSGSGDAASLAAAALGGGGSAVTTANTLSKLGLKPDQILKLTPALVKVVQSKGGAEVAALLAGALK